MLLLLSPPNCTNFLNFFSICISSYVKISLVVAVPHYRTTTKYFLVCCFFVFKPFIVKNFSLPLCISSHFNSMCTTFYPLRRGHLPYFTHHFIPRTCQIPSLDPTVLCISCRRMYNMYTYLSLPFFTSQYETKDLLFSCFPHTCLSLRVIASSCNYLVYCCYISPPYVCY
jgi:hypothetical protein